MSIRPTSSTSTRPTSAPSASLTAAQVAGIYVAKLGVPGPFSVAELVFKKDGTYSARVANISSGPSPAFPGTWAIKGDKITGSHTVPGMGKVSFLINAKGKSVADLKAGVEATIKMAGMGKLPFDVKKTDKPYF